MGALKYFSFVALVISVTINIILFKSHKSNTIKANHIEKCDTALVEIQEHACPAIVIEKELHLLKVKHKDVVLRQARLESGNFTSSLFINHNNAFSMMYPGYRPTTAIGKTSSGFAIYASLRDCVIDYAIWQYPVILKNRNKDKYIDYLNRFYAEDPDYDKKLRK